MKAKFIMGLQIILLTLIVQGCWARSEADVNKALSDKANISNANRYQLIKDGNKELCELNPLLCHKPIDLCAQLEKNFNSFKNEPPMVCGRKYNVSLGFSQPNWKLIPPESIDYEMLKQAFYSVNKKRFLSENMENHWMERRLKLKKMIETGDVKISQAQFDIDNDGKIENVILKTYGDCGHDNEWDFAQPGSPAMHVIANDGHLDDRYSRLDNTVADVFFYKNKTYMTQWIGRRAFGKGQIDVMETFKPRNRFGYSNKAICEFEFLD